jgi:YidC/Oxa1 family membrane protein insertase
MANQRIILWGALVLILWMNYQAWVIDHTPKTTTSPPSTQQPATAPAGAAAGSAQRLGESVPALDSSAALTAAGGTTAPAVAEHAEAAAPDSVHVVTDVLDLQISLNGGELVRGDLTKYPLHKDQPNVPVRLFDDSDPATRFVLQSGLTGRDPGSAPDHKAHFSAASREYRLESGQTQLLVPLTWSNAAGITVTKTFVFQRGKYQIDLTYDVRNASGQAWEAASYAQLLRHSPPLERSMFNVESYSFRGPAIWDGEKYRKLKVTDDKDKSFSQAITGGWLAALQHHFVAAIVPAAGQSYRYALQVQGEDFLLSARGPTQSVAAGAEGHFKETLFVGPKLQAQLVAAGPELDRTADYGKLTIIAKPLFMVLSWVHRLLGNWGWAIVFTTVLIKAAFYWLSQKSGRSMAKMRNLAPRMKALQERYKDSREQLGREMLELYKKEKVNPAAGCLPMLVQIPFFLAFYWVLLESVEMRQAPFGLWIQDLSSRDPWFVLPILNGLAMFGQYKLNPTPPDPVQAKVFMLMPIFMTFMFAWFPSGLVLYWVTNTVLSIAQQWNINRIVAAESGKRS